MRYQLFIYTAFLSIALPLFTTAEHHGPSRRRHTALANRKRTDLELQAFHRRDNNAQATFFDVGLGACGKWSSAGDFIVALNSCEYGGGSPGPQCFKMITIEYQGKQTQAQIMDECPTCACGGLDMSRGLFTFFAPESVGVFYMNWWYSSDSPPAPSSSSSPQPTSTWVPPPPTSSSVWVDPSPWTSQKPTSTWSPPSSTWTSSSSSSSFSSSSSSSSWNSTTSSSHGSTASSTSTSWSSTPASSPTPPAAENLQDINELVAQLGKLVLQYGS